MSDRETPSTSWAVWAWQAYREGRLVEVPAQKAKADRIEQLVATNEALVKEAKEMEAEVHAHIEMWGKALREKAAAEAKVNVLVVAGRAYREATRHFKPCPETSANFDAALKGN